MKREQQPAFLDRIATQSLQHILTKGIIIEGKEYIPTEGPAIIAINHTGWLEYPVALFALNEPIFHQTRVATLIKEETLQIPFFRNLADAFHMDMVTIDRKSLDFTALSQSIEVMKRKKILLMFPEQTRGREIDGNRKGLKPGKNGVALVAQKAANLLEIGIRIYPCSVYGTEGIFPEIDDHSIRFRNRMLFERQEAHVTFSPPIIVTPNTSFDKKTLQQITDSVMFGLRDSLPEQYHGVYVQ